MTSNNCPKPGDFSSYYSLDSLKQFSSSICGNVVPQLPGMTDLSFNYVSVAQKGGSGNGSESENGSGNGNENGTRIGYTATGELGSFNCGCVNQTGGNSNKQQCNPCPINDGLISHGPILALHAKPIGKRPVISTQGSINKLKGSQLLDRQFDCFQPFWSEKCD